MPICEFCNKDFELAFNRSFQKCCSGDCSKKLWFKKQSELRNSLIPEYTCEYCQNKFRPQRKLKEHLKKWCSNHCKLEAFKKEKRLANKERHDQMDKTCKFCNEKFDIRTHENEEYCSRKCLAEFHKAELRKQSAEIRAATVKQCLLCAKEFNPKRTLKEIYCSKHCQRLIGKRIYGMMQRVYDDTNTNKSDRSHHVLGYTPDQLLEHLKKCPIWASIKDDNWHLDHIFPIIAFVRKGITDPAIICCLENLQPMLGRKNCSKGSKYDQQSFDEWLRGKTNV